MLVVLLAGSAVSASVASAQSGNGLYEPFPEAAVKKRAERYVGRLGQVVGFSGQFVAVRFDGGSLPHLSLPGRLTTV